MRHVAAPAMADAAGNFEAEAMSICVSGAMSPRWCSYFLPEASPAVNLHKKHGTRDTAAWQYEYRTTFYQRVAF